MRTRVSSKGPSKRRASEGDSSHGKMVLTVEESLDLDASRRAIRSHQGVSVQAPVMSPSAPIDVEAIEDDVQLLPSSISRTFPRGNQSRRNHPITVVLDDDSDVQVQPSGTSDEPEIQVTINNDRQSHPLKRPLVNYEVHENYRNVESSCKSKRKCVAENPESQKAAKKEPAFTCAICLGHLTMETSTVCGHIFCLGCIKLAIQTQKRCPTCRKFLTVKNIHRVYLPAAH